MGAALLAAAVSRARGRGARRLVLWVWDGNTRARRFYAAAGFEAAVSHTVRIGKIDYDGAVLALPLD